MPIFIFPSVLVMMSNNVSKSYLKMAIPIVQSCKFKFLVFCNVDMVHLMFVVSLIPRFIIMSNRFKNICL